MRALPWLTLIAWAGCYAHTAPYDLQVLLAQHCRAEEADLEAEFMAERLTSEEYDARIRATRDTCDSLLARTDRVVSAP